MAPPKKTLDDFLVKHGTSVEEFRARYDFTKDLDLIGWVWEFFRRRVLSQGGGKYRIPLAGEVPASVHPLYRMTWPEIRAAGRFDTGDGIAPGSWTYEKEALHHMGIIYSPVRRVPWKSEAYRMMGEVDANGQPVDSGDGLWPYEGDRPLTDAPDLDQVRQLYDQIGVFGAEVVHCQPLLVVDLSAPRGQIEEGFKRFLDEELPKVVEKNPGIQRPATDPAGRDAENRWWEGDYLPIWDLAQHGAPPGAIMREFFADGDLAYRQTENDRKRHTRILQECNELIFGMRGKVLRERIVGHETT